MSVYFTKYGNPMEKLDFDDLLVLQQDDGGLVARAEHSASEGCCCEVAIWNEATHRWERFAFAKFLGGEHPELPNANSQQTAEWYADQINAIRGWLPPIIHRMPNHGMGKTNIGRSKTPDPTIGFDGMLNLMASLGYSTHRTGELREQARKTAVALAGASENTFLTTQIAIEWAKHGPQPLLLEPSFREHTCQCGHTWTARITHAANTPNISGEPTPWCPMCGKRAVSSSAPTVNAAELCTKLRSASYAVCVFSPDELGSADPKLVEDAMRERGRNAIEDLT